MKRTKLIDRKLPSYCKGEEIMNMVTHIVGCSVGFIALLLCLFRTIPTGSVADIIGVCIYGGAMILLYAISSVYHGLHPSTGKKVMQIIDHCAIYFLIAGTYTPILISAIIPRAPLVGWTLLFLEWGLASLATALTAIDSCCRPHRHRLKEVQCIFYDMLYFYGVVHYFLPAFGSTVTYKKWLRPVTCRRYYLHRWRDLVRCRRQGQVDALGVSHFCGSRQLSSISCDFPLCPIKKSRGLCPRLFTYSSRNLSNREVSVAS